jgi:ubiquinone/menaquinone biosynthesis C-methylase UbiE
MSDHRKTDKWLFSYKRAEYRAAEAAMRHSDTIQDQFTKQAVPFSEAKSIADENAIRLLIEAAEARKGQCSLDIACGPGLVALAFARVVDHATGLDATPAMLDRARQLQAERGVGNAEWIEGEAVALPFPDEAFDIVTCRFAFHHMEEPRRAFAEMLRVTKPGGMVVLCDGYAPDDAAKDAAFNTFERIRDPSTVRFLKTGDLHALFGDAGVQVTAKRRYRLAAEMEALIRISFPEDGGADRLRDMLTASLENDMLGFEARREGGRILFSYPALILAGRKPGLIERAG